MADEPEVTPEVPAVADFVPLRTPFASQKQFRAWVKDAEAKMLRPPWRSVAKFSDCRKGDYIAPDDPNTYAACTTQRQYHRLYVHIDPHHPGWKDERTGPENIRHEIAHSFFGEINNIIRRYVTDPKVLEALDEAEDDAVNRIATMPALEDHE